MDIELTPSQQEVCDEISNIFKNSTGRGQELLVTGSAGCGKSTSVFYELRKLLDEKPLNILFIAPTHNAVSVVKKICAKWGLDAEIQFATVASALKLKPKRINHKLRFVQSEPVSWYNDIVLIDEVSQIDQETFDMIQYAGDTAKMVIYLGDKCQLPPVTDPENNTQKIVESPIFKAIENNKHLTEVMRYAGDSLVVANHIRDKMEVGYVDLMALTNFDSDVIKKVSIPEIKTQFAKSYNEGKNIKVLAFRNTTVDAINAKIHEYLGYSDYFNIGAKIVNLTPIEMNQSAIPIETKIEIMGLNTSTYPMELLSSKLSHLSFEYTEIVGRVNPDDNTGFDFYGLSVDQKTNLDKVTKEVAKMAKEDPSLWKHYYYLTEKFIYCRLPYATTIHKSQGDTYDELILALPDLGYCRDFLLYNKLLYTAFTRSSGNIYIAS